MTTYADYKTAQETVGAYRAIAKSRVEDYVRSGKSGFGAIRVNDFTPDDDASQVYSIDFSMEIGVRKDGTVLVWATPMDDGESLVAYVPVEVLDGVLV